MLPSHTRSTKRRGDAAGVASVVIIALLIVGLVVCGWSLVSSQKQVLQLSIQVEDLEKRILIANSAAESNLAKYNHVTKQFHQLNKASMESGRQQIEKDTELQAVKNQLVAMEEDYINRQAELQAQVEHGKVVTESYVAHIQRLSEAHRAREEDWRGLAAGWKKFEEDSVAEIHQLKQEIQQLKGSGAPVQFNDPDLPREEPQDRPETRFDTEVEEPQMDPDAVARMNEQLHHNLAHQQIIMEQHRLQEMQRLNQQHNVHQHQQQHVQQPPSNPAGAHHDDMYAQHYYNDGKDVHQYYYDNEKHGEVYHYDYGHHPHYPGNDQKAKYYQEGGYEDQRPYY